MGRGSANEAEDVVSAIEAFRDRVNANDRFVKFKTLVGFESVFPPSGTARRWILRARKRIALTRSSSTSTRLRRQCRGLVRADKTLRIG